jgi:signal transduction histidine kinase
MNSSDGGGVRYGENGFSRAVLDGLDQLVVVFDADGTPVWWNNTVPSVTGYPTGEGQLRFVDIVADADRDRAATAVDRLVETGDLTVELPVETAEGDRLPIEFRGSSFRRNGERRLAVVGYDIADRREREQKLEGLRERTLELMETETKSETAQLAVKAADTIIEAPLSGIHFPDSAGTRLSPVATVASVAETFDAPPTYERDAPSGTRAALAWDVFDGNESVHIHNVETYQGLREASPAQSVILHPLGDHGLFIVSAERANAFDETDEALVDILAGALRAALDRVEREGRLRRQNDRLERFASIVSHDMRNPITTARGYLELTRETGDKSHLDSLEESLDRMAELVDDLLTLAREGEESLDPVPVDLATLAEESWFGIEASDATLRVEADRTVLADESRLQQLFENLFRNSLEHCGRPDPTVVVGDIDGGFFVADNGPGIPEAERERVLLSGYSTAEGGTGLGLSIVDEVADAQDWSLRITESADGGARFEFHGVETA